MTSFWRIFSLELKALVRGGALPLITLAACGWLLAAPYVLRGDGTASGEATVLIRYGLGGAVALVAVATLLTAAGSLARERELKRLSLTLVRPVRDFALVLARMAALVFGAALALAAVFAVYIAEAGVRSEILGTGCYHAYRPVMMSPRAEAELMYERFMKDPATPVEVKKAKKAVILRVLENRAKDHYQMIITNATERWHFALPVRFAGEPAVRLRFSTAMDQRSAVTGALALGDWSGAVSNITQAINIYPLHRAQEAGAPVQDVLSFRNDGAETVMLRPRRDIELLIPADGFVWNLLRAWWVLFGMIALLIAFAVTLSSALSRPVAVFVAAVTLALAEMSPSVLEQYPDPLEKNRIDAVGLAFTRFTAEVTHPLTALEPLQDLSEQTAIERKTVCQTLLTHFILTPCLLALLAGLVVRRT